MSWIHQKRRCEVCPPKKGMGSLSIKEKGPLVVYQNERYQVSPPKKSCAPTPVERRHPSEHPPIPACFEFRHPHQIPGMVSLSAEAEKQRSKEAEHELQLSNKANITCYLFYKIPQPLQNSSAYLNQQEHPMV